MHQMYLDDPKIALLLNQVTYKPGWSFTIHRHTWEGLCVDITITMPNSYKPGEDVTLNIRTPVPPIVNAKHFHDWLMWRLGRIESHEMREFYKVNGRVVDNPHAERVMMV
jgi:predicted metal-dependent enzyme (double-stranded beta helix superfamily)